MEYDPSMALPAPRSQTIAATALVPSHYQSGDETPRVLRLHIVSYPAELETSVYNKNARQVYTLGAPDSLLCFT